MHLLQIRTILSYTKRGKFCLTFEGKQLPMRFQNVVAELLLDYLLAENEGDR